MQESLIFLMQRLIKVIIFLSLKSKIKRVRRNISLLFIAIYRYQLKWSLKIYDCLGDLLQVLSQRPYKHYEQTSVMIL